MNKYIIILILSSVIVSCDKEDKNPCDVLINGIYQYPELPENHGWTKEQINEYVNLPEDICGCISTAGLVETCMNYPYLSLIWAGASPQSGYGLVKKQFRGLEELERRTDAGTVLLAKYITMSPLDYDTSYTSVQRGAFSFNFYAFELIFSQEVQLKKLTKKEKISLVEDCLEKYYLKLNDPEQIFSVTMAAESTTLILRNLMLMDEYVEFLDVFNSNFTAYELIIDISFKYLTFLKR